MVAALILLPFFNLDGVAVAQENCVIYDEGRVLMTAPARDAAFVADLAGFKSVVANSFLRQLFLSEGLVIRQSHIQDGKIIIPPSGLYYTTRTPLSKALQGDKILILGEIYYFVDYSTRLDVVTHKDMVSGDCVPIGDGSKCWHLSSIDFSFASEIPIATFQILKPSGNYYGIPFPVITSDLVTPITALAKGRGYEDGSFPPGYPDGWQNLYYGYHVATSGQSFIAVENVTTTGLRLLEAATGAIKTVWITAEDPVEASLAEDETMEVGHYVVRVAALDAEAQTVDVEIWEDGKIVASKTFGPLTEDFFNFIPEDPIARESVMLSYKDDVYVHLDLFRGPFQENAASLVAYYDLIRLDNPDVWPFDDRFIARLDACSTCSMPIELMLENIEPVMLDAIDNVFVGPNRFFQIAIDEFDGDSIQAWHIEDSEGNVSENLARRSGGRHIDLLLNKNVRTVWTFGSQIAANLIAEEQRLRIDLEQQIADLQKELELFLRLNLNTNRQDRYGGGADLPPPGEGGRAGARLCGHPDCCERPGGQKHHR